MPPPRWFFFSLVCALVLVAPTMARPKTDVVVLKNGDRLTGEIKSLSRDKLSLKTDDLATVQIEWEDIASIRSAERFQVELEDGTRHSGSLEVGAAASSVRVVSAETAVELELAHIVRIRPIEIGFWKRLDGSLDSGFNYTHSSAVGTFSFEADVQSRTERYEREASLSAFITKQESGTTSRDDLSFITRRLFKNRWFGLVLGALQTNDELGIDLRTLAAAGVGRRLIQTNHALLTVAGGANANNERVSGESSGKTSGELLAVLSYSVFRYDYPHTDLTLGLFVFPSVTVSGRVRGELDVSLKREILKDFHWGLTGYDSYDSQPASSEAQTNDWGIVNSFGWTF